MRITVLAGGVGGARFLRGLKAAAPRAEITVIGNTGDDITLFGLHVSPDLDTVMYTLGGGISEEQGWGRADDTFTVLAELAAYGAGPGWFGLGDRDFATHIARTGMLRDGLPLSAATRSLCERWQPGVTLLPMTDDRVETHVTIERDEPPGRQTVHFQEWWVRLHAAVPAAEIVFTGRRDGDASAGGARGDRRRRLRPVPAVQPGGQHRGHPRGAGHHGGARGPRPWSGVSPIIGGAPVRGMADACLTAIGVATTAAGGRRALRRRPARRLAGRRPGQGRGRRPGRWPGSRSGPFRSS